MLGNLNGNTLTNAAGATINTTGAFNDGMAANGSGNTLINNGTITTTGPNAYGMTAAWGQTNTGQLNNVLINTGTVLTSGSNRGRRLSSSAASAPSTTAARCQRWEPPATLPTFRATTIN